jgi:hypothetical protein
MNKNLPIRFFKTFLMLSIFMVSVPHFCMAAFPISYNQHLVIKDTLRTESNNLALPNATNKEDTGVLGIISIILAILGYLASTAGLAFILVFGAFLTGLFGVQRNRKLKGLAIVGLIAGFVGVAILLLAGVIL